MDEWSRKKTLFFVRKITFCMKFEFIFFPLLLSHCVSICVCVIFFLSPICTILLLVFFFTGFYANVGDSDVAKKSRIFTNLIHANFVWRFFLLSSSRVFCVVFFLLFSVNFVFLVSFRFLILNETYSFISWYFRLRLNWTLNRPKLLSLSSPSSTNGKKKRMQTHRMHIEMSVKN